MHMEVGNQHQGKEPKHAAYQLAVAIAEVHAESELPGGQSKKGNRQSSFPKRWEHRIPPGKES